MAVVFSLKNARSIDPLCQFNVFRFTRADPSIDYLIDAPCSLCLIPSEICNLVQTEREYTVANPLEAWAYQLDPAYAPMLLNLASEWTPLVRDAEQEGCHWTYTTVQSSGGITATVLADMAITINAGDPQQIDMLLTVTITITGLFGDSHAVTYSLEEVSPTDLGAFILTADTDLTGRTWTFPNSDYLVWPAQFSVAAEDP